MPSPTTTSPSSERQKACTALVAKLSALLSSDRDFFKTPFLTIAALLVVVARYYALTGAITELSREDYTKQLDHMLTALRTEALTLRRHAKAYHADPESQEVVH